MPDLSPRLAKLQRICPACHRMHAAYRMSGKVIGRVSTCPHCKAERVPSAVQYRMAWKCYRTARKLADQYSYRYGVDSAVTHDVAEEAMIRAATRYSWLNRPFIKFITYAYSCAARSLSRWTQSDGGIAAQRDVISKCPLTKESNALDGIEARGTVSAIEHIEQVGYVRDALTDSEYRTLTDYADGRRNPADPDVVAVLQKARCAILTAGRRQ